MSKLNDTIQLYEIIPQLLINYVCTIRIHYKHRLHSTSVVGSQLKFSNYTVRLRLFAIFGFPLLSWEWGSWKLPRNGKIGFPYETLHYFAQLLSMSADFPRFTSSEWSVHGLHLFFPHKTSLVFTCILLPLFLPLTL